MFKISASEYLTVTFCRKIFDSVTEYLTVTFCRKIFDSVTEGDVQGLC